MAKIGRIIECMKDLDSRTHTQSETARLDTLRKRIGRDPALSPAEAKELEDLSKKLEVTLNRSEKGYAKAMKKKGKTKEPGRLALIVICSIFAIGAASAASNNFLSADRTAPGTSSEKTTQNITPQEVTKDSQASAPSPQTTTSSPSTNSPVTTPKTTPSSGCTTTPIPHTVEFVNDNFMAIGETRVDDGKDGYTVSCPPIAAGDRTTGYTIQPVNKRVYVGTEPLPAPTPESTETREERIARCLRNLRAQGGSGSILQICYTI